jgi:hypothetical protein
MNESTNLRMVRRQCARSVESTSDRWHFPGRAAFKIGRSMIAGGNMYYRAFRPAFRAVAFCTALFCAGSALADSFGAIAYSPRTGATGWSYGKYSRGEAERAAGRNCDRYADDCRTAIWFKNACGALATGPNRGWGADWGYDRREAEYRAIGTCSRNAQGCEIRRWQCSGVE